MRSLTRERRLTYGENTPENERKLAELILYVVDRCGQHPRFGATKLNKILFWADFYAYARTGKPLTGVEYMRQQLGPVPRRLVPVRERLVQEDALDVNELTLFNGKRRTRFFAKRHADLSIFTAAELDLVNEIIDYLRDDTADEVSKQTHGRTWEILATGDLFPYEAVFVSDREVTDADIAMVRELGVARNWRERIIARRGSPYEQADALTGISR